MTPRAEPSQFNSRQLCYPPCLLLQHISFFGLFAKILTFLDAMLALSYYIDILGSPFLLSPNLPWFLQHISLFWSIGKSAYFGQTLVNSKIEAPSQRLAVCVLPFEWNAEPTCSAELSRSGVRNAYSTLCRSALGKKVKKHRKNCECCPVSLLIVR